MEVPKHRLSRKQQVQYTIDNTTYNWHVLEIYTELCELTTQMYSDAAPREVCPVRQVYR